MDLPRVSIVTPSFQQAATLEHTIVSVLEQAYPNLEYFVMDGGSTDGSLELIKKYADHITYWQSRPDGGQVQAINTGLRKANGAIFAFLNSDDFLLPGALRTIVQAYEKSPEAAGWVGEGYGITPAGYILELRRPRALAGPDLANWMENWFYQPSCFFSGAVTRQVGYLDPTHQNAFDFEFWMRISQVGRLVPVHAVISATRVHPDTKTLSNMAGMLEEMEAIQRKCGYHALASATRPLIEQARRQPRRSTAAKLLYRTAMTQRRAPNRFVRLPGTPEKP